MVEAQVTKTKFKFEEIINQWNYYTNDLSVYNKTLEMVPNSLDRPFLV